MITLFFGFLSIQWISRLSILFFYKIEPLTVSDIIQMFGYGLKQDVSITGYLCLISLLFYLISYYFQSKIGFILFKTILYLLVLLNIVITLADIQLLSLWSHKIDLQALFYLQYPHEVFNNFNLPQWLIFVLVILVLTWLIGALFLRILRKKETSFSAINAKYLGGVFLTLFLMIRGGLGLMPVLISDASYSESQPKNSVATNSLWNFFYQITEAGNLSEIQHLLDYPENKGILNRYFADTEPDFPPYYWDKRTNVVLIILEGFSAEMSGYFGGHDGNEMPFIDSLAKEGYAFTRVYANGDRTDKGLLSILSGWPGQTWQNMINHPSKINKLPALARAFKEKRGYKTKFYYGGDLGFSNMDFYLKQNGFESIFGEKNIVAEKSVHQGKWGVHDDALFDFVSENLKSEKEEFFATILTLSTHEPYDLAPKNAVTNKEKMAYCMRFTDRSVRNFISKMQKHPDFDNTLFVITADHGKELNTENTSKWHQNFFHIPLLFYGKILPTKWKGKVNNRVVSQSDIYQSLHHLIIQRKDKKAVYSRSFFESNHPGNAISNLTGTTVYIDSLSCQFLQTDKMAIRQKKSWNSIDSLLIGVQSKIIQYFLR